MLRPETLEEARRAQRAARFAYGWPEPRRRLPWRDLAFLAGLAAGSAGVFLVASGAVRW